MLVGRQRSHGCILCRKRKIKCDETKPSCRNCATYGQECPGYLRTVPLIFRDENHNAERLAWKNRRPAQKARPVASPGAQLGRTAPGPAQSTVPRFRLDSSWEHHGHCYFLDQFTLPTEPDGSPGPLDSVPWLYNLCRDERETCAPVASLRAALDAAAFASLANQGNIPALAILARRKYGQALRELNLALGSVKDAVRNETLGTIVMLMLFEDINGERNSLMSTHISGIQYLLKLRGTSQLADPAARSLFHFAFTQMMIQFMGLKDPVRIDLDWLLDVLTIPHPIYNMMAGNIKISKYCASVSQVLSRIDSDHPPDGPLLVSLLERGEHLDLEFNKWHQGLPEEWMPRRILSNTGSPMLLYPDRTSAGVWNYYRSTRIVLQQTMQEIARCSGAPVEGVPSTWIPGQISILPVPKDIITQMVTEICQSLPFALGEVDLFGNPILPLPHLRPDVRAIQGFALLWPIFSVPQSEHATEAQAYQAREALLRIASTHGIRLGMDLSSQTVQQDRVVSPSSSRISNMSPRWDSS